MMQVAYISDMIVKKKFLGAIIWDNDDVTFEDIENKVFNALNRLEEEWTFQDVVDYFPKKWNAIYVEKLYQIEL